jgi:flagellar export protein FliJ
MKHQTHVKSLNTLVDLREREVERLSTDMAAKQLVKDRYVLNLERMARLCETLGPVASQGLVNVAQTLNTAYFKAAVTQMADQHRQDLALHEADMAVTGQALKDAATRQEVLQQLLTRHQQTLQRERQVREQKQQDDLATQVWLRGRA